MRIEGVAVKSFRSFDGTKIAYQDVGKGPVLVFANGLGGTFEAWIHLVNHLKENHRILSWDYRGMYGSGRPRLSNLRIVDHVRDLELLLELEGVSQAVLAGWSMGTQVCFEFAGQHPEKVRGLVIICGAAGKPFDTALNWRGTRVVLPAVLKLLMRLHRLEGPAIKAMLAVPHFLDLLKVTGMLARDGDLETFRYMAADFAGLDFEAYNQIMLELGRHDARDVLPRIRVPTMIFTADQDFFTPDSVSEEMCRRIPDCRLITLGGAGHYAPLEFPQRFNDEIDAFFRERLPHLHAPAHAPASAGTVNPPAAKPAKRPAAKKPAAKRPAPPRKRR
jgi:pimeloyl-ACP methyl ester carboxylesterase